MQKVSYNKSLGNKLKPVNMPNIKLPKWTADILNESKNNGIFTVESQDIVNGRIMNKGFNKSKQAKDYLRNRTNAYEKEIRKSQVILKRKNLTDATKKKHQKNIKELEKRVTKIEDTRELRAEREVLKAKKLAKQAELKMIEENEKRGIGINNEVIEDIQDAITEIDNEISMLGKGSIKELITRLEQSILRVFGDSGGVKLQRTSLCGDLIAKLKSLTKKIKKSKIDDIVDKCMDVLDKWYNMYYANHGYNTYGQFVMGQLAKGFKNNELVGELMEVINSEIQ